MARRMARTLAAGKSWQWLQNNERPPFGGGPSIVLLHVQTLAEYDPREDDHAPFCRMRRGTMRHSITSFRLLTMQRIMTAPTDNSSVTRKSSLRLATRTGSEGHQSLARIKPNWRYWKLR